jgi:hypothetical protein
MLARYGQYYSGQLPVPSRTRVVDLGRTIAVS